MSALLRVEDLRVEIPTPMGLLHAVRGVDLALMAGIFWDLGEEGSTPLDQSRV